MRLVIRVAVSCLALLCFTVSTAHAAAAPAGTVKVALRRFNPEYHAYAQVQPQRVIVVKAAATGVIASLRVLPGERVYAGESLAKLTGPDYRTGLAAALARRSAARSNLAVTQENYPQFSSTQDVSNARVALAEAESALKRVQAADRLRAPADGIVLSVTAADGERVAPGQALVTLQPSGQLWLRAAYYGADAAAIQVGMTGEFSPADGLPPIPVKVATVFGMLSPDGGESVGLLAATPAPVWLNGEFGTVTLEAPARQLVAVPTRALILDAGRWWVLVRTTHGDRHQVVIPGPALGWLTFIEHGLMPGVDVVVENVYLEFHRGISKTYTPPD